MSKPTGTLLIELLERKQVSPAGYGIMAEAVRIITAEVHAHLSGGTGKAAWDVIDEMEAAAEELRKHGKTLEE